MATENPVEQEGTYPLPEAQVDRFMLKICVGYPSREEERLILDRMAHAEPSSSIQPIITPEQILRARQTVDEIYIDDKIKAYIIDLVFATREPKQAGLNSKNTSNTVLLLVQPSVSPWLPVRMHLWKGEDM